MPKKIIISLSILAAYFVSGCTGYQAFSKIARTGDTVALAIGSSPRNEINSFVDKSNMTVAITDSAGSIFDVTLHYLFKLNGDNSSKHNYNATYDGISQNPPRYSRFFRDPNQGEWIAVIDLVDPISGVAPPLTIGAATIAISTLDLHDTLPDVFGFFTDGALSSIDIEILPGTGTPHTYNDTFGNPDALEPLPKIQISFDNANITTPLDQQLNNAVVIGGLEFTIDYDETVFNELCSFVDTGGIPTDFELCPPMVRGNEHEPRISVISAEVTESGNKKIRVIVMSEPGAGIIASPDPSDLLDNHSPYLKYTDINDLMVNVIWDPNKVTSPINPSNFNTVFQITDVKVFDTNGDPLLDSQAIGPLTTEVLDFHNH